MSCLLYTSFNGTGYNFYIRKNGAIKTTREIERIGAPAKGHNQNSIGSGYEGGLDCHGHPADTRTEWQVHSMHVLILTLLRDYPGCRVCGHRDLKMCIRDSIETPSSLVSRLADEGNHCPLQPVLPWEKLVDQLSTFQSYMELAGQHSGLGKLFVDHQKLILEIFKKHIRLYDKMCIRDRVEAVPVVHFRHSDQVQLFRSVILLLLHRNRLKINSVGDAYGVSAKYFFRIGESDDTVQSLCELVTETAVDG